MLTNIFYSGAGNVRTLHQALLAAGTKVRVETDPDRLLDADSLVLPGAGAFGPSAGRLRLALPGLHRALESGFPCLGIGVGMQLLFESSEEASGSGLAFMRGRVRRIRARRVPQMGWNTIDPRRPDEILDGARPLIAYFASSYVVEPAYGAAVVAVTDYLGTEVPAVVRRKRTWGVQFRPEKSGRAGLRLIRNFVVLAHMPSGAAS